MAAPMMPASLSSCAGTISARGAQVLEELVLLLADAAADNEEIGREEELEMVEVLVHIFRPLLPGEPLFFADAGGGAMFGVFAADLQMAELRIGQELAVHEDG